MQNKFNMESNPTFIIANTTYQVERCAKFLDTKGSVKTFTVKGSIKSLSTKGCVKSLSPEAGVSP